MERTLFAIFIVDRSNGKNKNNSQVLNEMNKQLSAFITP